MPCSQHCQQCSEFAVRSLQGRPWGGYNMLCAPCCARLVRSARPLRMAQDAMLACIARHEGAPSRAAVLRALKAMDAS